MPDTILNQTEVPTIAANRSAEIKDLAMALAKAQAVMTGAAKDANNPHFKTKYADLASVWDAVRKPLTDNDLAIVQFPRTAGQGVEIETTIVHGKSGQFMCGVLWVPCAKNDAQGLGSAITYGRRYALMSATGIAPVEEDDGNAAAASYKPASGTAGAGGQFRPERRHPGMAQTESLRVEPGDRHMVQGDGRSQYEVDKAKKAAASEAAPAGETAETAADKKARKWVDDAIATLKLPGQHVESLDKWWRTKGEIPPGAKISPLSWLEQAAALEHERLLKVFTEIRDNAKNVSAA